VYVHGLGTYRLGQKVRGQGHSKQWPEKRGEYNIFVNIWANFTKIGSETYLLSQKFKVTAGGSITVDGSPTSFI